MKASGSVQSTDTAHLVRRRNIVWLVAGHMAMAMAMVGAVLPLLPTTCFVLLAASCYYKGSPRFHDRLLRHPTFGRMICDWRESRSMSRSAKRYAVVTVVLTISLSIFLVSSLVVRIILGVTMVSLIVMFTRIRTKPDGEPAARTVEATS